LNKGEL